MTPSPGSTRDLRARRRRWGYAGSITWDSTKPDGTPRKLFDAGRINALGWFPQISLEKGLADTVAWYFDHRSYSRGGHG
jgi:GDP-L-fucose synthase